MGCATKQHFKGKLPYTLRTTSEIVAYNPPHSFAVNVVGDLTGSGQTDRLLLKLLTPVARPLFRSNHDWSVERAQAGLEPSARAQAGLQPKP
jgi:hypothetical protein